MFNKIFYGIITIIIILSLNILFISSHLINKHKETAKFIQNETINLLPNIYHNILGGNIMYNGNYKKTNNIDIIISNHINHIDFIPVISTIRQFDDRFIYIIMKREIKHLYPIAGGILKNCSIMLVRNYEKDKHILRKLTKTISNSIIFLFPEGTTFSKIQHIKGITYSLQNNLPVMTKTLYPKMKGIYQIVDELSKQNKLGNIIDFTLIMENMMGSDKDYVKQISKNKINTFNNINSYIIPKFNNYEDFKQWFIKKWHIKNNIIEKYRDYNYKKINIPFRKSFLILLFILFIITIYLLQYYPITYLFLNIIIYLIHAF